MLRYRNLLIAAWMLIAGMVMPSEVVITAESAGTRDEGHAAIGVGSGADGLDGTDRPHPPRLPLAFVDLHTSHTVSQDGWTTQALSLMEYRLEGQAALGDSEERDVPLYLRADAPTSVTLAWAGLGAEELVTHSVALVDLASSASVDLRLAGSTLVAATAQPRPLVMQFRPVPCPLPGAPSALAATEGTLTDRVRLDWQAGPRAEETEVFRAPTQDFSGAASLGQFAGLSFDDTTVATAQPYWYWIRSRNACGDSSFRGPVLGYTGCPEIVAPGSVAASDGASPETVSVTWELVAGASRYGIYWAETANEAAAVRIGEAAAPPFADARAPGQAAFYWVRAESVCGNGPLGGPDAGSTSCPLPSVPVLAASQGTVADAVELTWTESSRATSYTVVRSLGETTTVIYIGPAVAARDASAARGQVYAYDVRAANGCGTVASAPVAGWRPCVVPEATSLAATTDAFVDHVEITWTSPVAGASWQVYRSLDPMTTGTLVSNCGCERFEDYGMPLGRTVYYRLVGTNECGTGTVWGPVSGRTTPGGSLADTLVQLQQVYRELERAPGQFSRCRLAHYLGGNLLALLGSQQIFAPVREALEDVQALALACDPATGTQGLEMLRDLAYRTEHAYETALAPPSAILEPGEETTFTLVLANAGLADETYDLDLGTLPAGVTATLSAQEVSLAMGDALAPGEVTLNLRSDIDTTAVFNATVTVTPRSATDLALPAAAYVSIRSAFADVLAVIADPPAADAGALVAIEASVFNTASLPREAMAVLTVRDEQGFEVLAPRRVAVHLPALADAFAIDLGTVDTTGWATGVHEAEVFLEDTSGRRIPGRLATGPIAIGVPVRAWVAAYPDALPPGDSTILTQIFLQHTRESAAPPDYPPGTVSIFEGPVYAIHPLAPYACASRSYSFEDLAAGSLLPDQPIPGVQVTSPDGTPLTVMEANPAQVLYAHSGTKLLSPGGASLAGGTAPEQRDSVTFQFERPTSIFELRFTSRETGTFYTAFPALFTLRAFDQWDRVVAERTYRTRTFFPATAHHQLTIASSYQNIARVEFIDEDESLLGANFSFDTFAFEPVGDHKVDYVFLLDTSPSMRGEIDGLLEAITRWVAATDSEEIDARYAVLNMSGTRPIINLTPCANRFVQALAYAKGRGSSEAGMESIRMALGLAAEPMLEPIRLRPDARTNIILLTDEDSDRPAIEANRIPGQDTDDPPVPLTQPWQDEIGLTADAVATSRAYLNLVVSRWQGQSMRQYGRPASEMLDPQGRFDRAATLAALESIGLGDTLQAQVLRTGLLARSFDVEQVALDPAGFDSLLAAKLDEARDQSFGQEFLVEHLFAPGASFTGVASPARALLSSTPSMASLAWRKALGDSLPSRLDLETEVLGMEPGEVREISLGTFVTGTYRAENDAVSTATIALAPLAVASAHVAAITPEIALLRRGTTATLHLELSNRSASPLTYRLEPVGFGALLAEWPATVPMAPGATTEIAVPVGADAWVTPGDYPVSILVAIEETGGSDIAGAIVRVTPESPVFDIAPAGVSVEIGLGAPEAPYGIPATFQAIVTNLGSETATYSLAGSAAGGYAIAFASDTVTVEPGFDAQVSVPFTLAAPEVWAPQELLLSVTAVDIADAASTATDTDAFAILGHGLVAEFVPATFSAPADALLRITHYDAFADTIEVSLGGDAAPFFTEVAPLEMGPNSTATIAIPLLPEATPPSPSQALEATATALAAGTSASADATMLVGLYRRFNVALEPLSEVYSDEFFLYRVTLTNTGTLSGAFGLRHVETPDVLNALLYRTAPPGFDLEGVALNPGQQLEAELSLAPNRSITPNTIIVEGTDGTTVQRVTREIACDWPAPPSRVDVSTTNPLAIDVSWEPVPDTIGYWVDSGFSRDFVEGTTHTLQLAGLFFESTDITVTSVNDCGVGVPSAPELGACGSPVADVAVTSDAGLVRVQWTAVGAVFTTNLYLTYEPELNAPEFLVRNDVPYHDAIVHRFCEAPALPFYLWLEQETPCGDLVRSGPYLVEEFDAVEPGIRGIAATRDRVGEVLVTWETLPGVYDTLYRFNDAEGYYDYLASTDTGEYLDAVPAGEYLYLVERYDDCIADWVTTTTLGLSLSELPTPTPTPAPSATPTVTPTATDTPTPSASESATPSASPSLTASPSPSETESPTPSASPSETESPTPSASPSETESPTPSASPSLTASPSPSETESPTPSASPSESATPSASPSESATPSASPSLTASPSPSETESPTPSASPSETESPTPSASPSESATPSASPSLTASPSPSETESPTPSASPSLTASPSPSETESPTPSASPSLTASPSPSETESPTPSASPSESATPSASPSLTASPSPSETESPTPSTSPSESATPSASPSLTASPSPSETESPTPSASPSETESPTPSASPSLTASPSPSETESPTPSASPSDSATPSASPSLTASPSPSETESPTPSASPSESATPSASPSLTASPSPSETESPTPSASPSESATPSASPSLTASPSPSETESPTPSASPSESATPSASPSLTASPSPSETESPTPSASPSLTASPSPSETELPTPSASPSETESPTPSASPSESATPSASPSLTASPSPSLTASPSPSLTASPSPSPTGGLVVDCSGTTLGAVTAYNVFLFGDMTQSGTDAEGRVAAGGTVSLSSYSVGLLSPNSNGSTDSLVAGGNLTFWWGTVYAGNVAHGGTFTGSVTIPNGTRRQQSGVIDFAAERTRLRAISTAWGSLAATGTTTVQYWGGPTCQITLNGSRSDLNVFTVNGTDLSKANTFTVNVPSGSSVLVNVTGTAGQMKNFGMFLNGATRTKTVYNFPAATTLRLESIGVEGTVLAPYAAVTFPHGVLKGTLFAESLTGNGQFDLHTHNGCVPQVTP